MNAGEQDCEPGMHKTRFLSGFDVSQHFSPKAHRVLLLVIQLLVLPALLQDGYREELEWRKKGSWCF